MQMLEIKPILIGQALKIEAIERGKRLGGCEGRLLADKLYIDEIDCNDEFIYDGIVRAALNTAALNGVDKAEFMLSDLHLIKKLGFIMDNKMEIDSIEQFLTKCKKCMN